ncbi:MAG: hypothetical protein IJA02_12245 [Clostridia bacterium]|nr:hypothetical protein [Clostridia bacterium]
MLLKSVFFDSTHEYIAKLENGVFIMGYSDGTATGTDGNRYRHIVELDDDENIIKDGWEIIE